MLILTGHSDPDALTIKIGPALIFERLWEQAGIKKALQRLLKARRFEFDVERAVFLHRPASADDIRLRPVLRSLAKRLRRCRYRSDRTAPSLPSDGVFGDPRPQTAASDLAPRCNKDLIEEDMFKSWR